ncbi:MAG: four helix bundle protein [Gemmatimonadales bacterium]
MSLDTLEAWKLGKAVAVRIYRLSRQKPLKYHPKLADQIQRSAISVPSNIAEGYGLGTKAQLVKGLRIAQGSALELRTQFDIARDVPVVADSTVVDDLANDIRRLSAMINGLLKRYDAEPPT